jgi:hypothetical protein
MQAAYGEQPHTDKFSGLDQSVTPTVMISGSAFSMRGVVERHQRLQRLPGKVAEMHRGGDVFHIHVTPTGERFLHVYGEGLIFIPPDTD